MNTYVTRKIWWWRLQ